MDEKTRRRRDEYREQIDRRLEEVTRHPTFDERLVVKDIKWLSTLHIFTYGDNRG